MANGLYNNTTCSTLGDDTQHIVEVDAIQANMFFDGTGNNYYNVTATEDIKRKHGGMKDKDTSYDNDLTNIARMWQSLVKERDFPEPMMYVEGIGTMAYQDDNLVGYALGDPLIRHVIDDHGTGIKARVTAAFASLKEEVKKKRKTVGLPAILKLNIFGFSRGAAAARLFVHLVNEEKSARFGADWDKVAVQVNFVGLFDSVSSEGIDHGNDVEDLHQKIESDHAQHVLHLIALDEYRENFSVTTVAAHNVCTKPVVHELRIPGAHSDVGGSYPDFVREKRDLSSTETPIIGRTQQTLRGTCDFAYTQGFYIPNDAHPEWSRPDLHRRDITSDYYRVALAIMVDAAKQYTTTDYPGTLTATPAMGEIETVRKELREFFKANAKPGISGSWIWSLDEKRGAEAARTFRRQYLHLSWQEGVIGLGPRFKNDHELEREYVPG